MPKVTENKFAHVFSAERKLIKMSLNFFILSVPDILLAASSGQISEEVHREDLPFMSAMVLLGEFGSELYSRDFSRLLIDTDQLKRISIFE